MLEIVYVRQLVYVCLRWYVRVDLVPYVYTNHLTCVESLHV